MGRKREKHAMKQTSRLALLLALAAAPAAVPAADATKGFAIKTYDIDNPSADAATAVVRVRPEEIGGGKSIPCAVYYSEATDNSTSGLLLGITTDSPAIQFVVHKPDMPYLSTKRSYNLGGVDFQTDCYISFAGYCKSARAGYKAAGMYVFGADASQSAAGTDNAYLGCSWMNNGEDYHWAGEKSDAYPFFVFDVVLPGGIASGVYKVTFCDYNTDRTGLYDLPSPMVESDGQAYTKKGGNLKLDGLTIVVDSDPSAPLPIPGDANRDGTVDLADAILIRQAAANPGKYGADGTDGNRITAQGLANADVDGVAGVDTNDAQRIQRWLLALVDPLVASGDVGGGGGGESGDELPVVTLWGDANCDGDIVMSDINLIMQSLAHPNKYGLGGTDSGSITAQGLANSAVNITFPGITVGDALRIQEYLLKKVSSLDPTK
jgi:hypothetical protein